ncbi:MAG: TatD family hydrolase, partial [Pseudomonadota bacterium]
MNTPFVIDSHCHLDYLQDKGFDLDEVVADATRANVAKMVTISTKMSKMDRVLAIAERYAQVYATVGVHPHEADIEPLDNADALLAWAQNPKIVGIGETGLDY